MEGADDTWGLTCSSCAGVQRACNPELDKLSPVKMEEAIWILSKKKIISINLDFHVNTMVPLNIWKPTKAHVTGARQTGYMMIFFHFHHPDQKIRSVSSVFVNFVQSWSKTERRVSEHVHLVRCVSGRHLQGKIQFGPWEHKFCNRKVGFKLCSGGKIIENFDDHFKNW